MAKVLCPAAECVHYKEGKCMAKEVPLRQWQINTQHEGRRTMWECTAYELTEKWKEIQKELDILRKAMPPKHGTEGRKQNDI